MRPSGFVVLRAPLDFHVNRSLAEGTYALRDVFQADQSPGIVAALGARWAGIDTLQRVRVELVDSLRYMWIRDEDGCLMVSLPYLKSADDCTLYLDLVHELTHVRQFWEGADLFDKRYRYVDRPTEVEAYQITVTEARRLGFTDRELYEYLRVEWISQAELRRLAERLGVQVPSP